MRFAESENFKESEEFSQFKGCWKRLWVEKVNPIRQVIVNRGSDPVGDIEVPATMRVLCGVPSVLTSLNVFLRDEYDKALSAISLSREKVRGCIIVGHPGIGVTNSWLSYD
jgi:hypothetical protein